MTFSPPPLISLPLSNCGFLHSTSAVISGHSFHTPMQSFTFPSVYLYSFVHTHLYITLISAHDILPSMNMSMPLSSITSKLFSHFPNIKTSSHVLIPYLIHSCYSTHLSFIIYSLIHYLIHPFAGPTLSARSIQYQRSFVCFVNFLRKFKAMPSSKRNYQTKKMSRAALKRHFNKISLKI